MRFKLEAEPQELLTKGDTLVEHLVKAFSDIHPELSDRLEKALPPKEPSLKFRVLREMKALTRKEYERTLKRMVIDIGKVLDQSVVGGALKKSLTKANQFSDETEETDSTDETDEEYDEETGEPLPEKEDEPEDSDDEEKVEKAIVSHTEPERDYSQPIAEKDGRAYKRITTILKRKGYKDADFEEGGKLHGVSTNDLRELAKNGN